MSHTKQSQQRRALQQLRRGIAKLAILRFKPASTNPELWQEILRLRRIVAYYKNRIAELETKFGTAPLPAPREPEPRAFITERKREANVARTLLVAEITRLGATFGISRTIRIFVQLAETGRLPEKVRLLVSKANELQGNKRTVSRSSFFRWMREAKRFPKGGAS